MTSNKSVQYRVNKWGKPFYEGVELDTPMSELEFHEALDTCGTDIQCALHTNLGSITVLDRVTGFEGGVRDTETGFRDADGKFWLASGMCDVRFSGAKTVGESIEWIKSKANTCVGY
jgi:hypothetical protein